MLLSIAGQGTSTSSPQFAAAVTSTPSGTQPSAGGGAGEVAAALLTDAEITALNDVGLEELLEQSARFLGDLVTDDDGDGADGGDHDHDHGPYAPPEWLGEILLEDRSREGDFYETPEELVNREIRTVDVLPPPENGEFVFTIDEVSDDVAERSTWRSRCPVGLEDLRYITLSHWGFDGGVHTGELIVHAEVAVDMVTVFRKLYDVRYPIEEMRVVGFELTDSEPTGDQNITTSFVCRSSTVGSHWSEHAFGLAIDINPFQNPYIKGRLLIPQLAEAYLDRERDAPGIITGTDQVVEAFDEIGWGWGGNWTSALDYMHFSHNNR